MIQKKWTLLSLSAASLFMASCDDGENIEEMHEATLEIDRIKNETIEGLNELYALENDLQERFSETLETDTDLATLADGSSPVFANIASRQEIINQLETNQDELGTNKDTLDTYEGEQLQQQEVDDVTAQVDTFNEHLSSYREMYQLSLDNQRVYFTSLSDEEATYDDFVEGIQSVNEERQSVREHLLELDDELVVLDESVQTLMNTMEELLNEE